MSCGLSSVSRRRHASRCVAIGAALAASLGLAAARYDPGFERVAFHHLHLVSANPSGTAGFYARLFGPLAVSRGSFFGFDGVRGDDIFLLISPLENQRRSPNTQTALWHFGWGAMSIDQDYRSHLLSEVAWEPPFEGLSSGFHLHLNSRDPAAAGEWYRRVFGGGLELATANADRDRKAAAGLVLPEAIVRFDRIALIIYPFDGPLAPVNAGHIADHIAFGTADLDATLARLRDAGVTIFYDELWLEHTRAALIEGPDAMIIELVEQLTAR